MHRPRKRLSLILRLLTALLFLFGALAAVPAFRVTSSGVPVVGAASAQLLVKRLGGYDTPGNAQQAQVVGALAYIADRNGGLQIVDVSKPASPVLRGAYRAPGDVVGVKVVASRVYLTYSNSGGLRPAQGLQILDVSHLASPRLLGGYSPGGALGAIEVVGNLAYVVAFDHIDILDVSDPTRPTLRGALRGGGFLFGALEVVGNLLYVTVDDGDRGGLQIVDITNPSSPRARGLWAVADQDVSDVVVAGGLAYVALTTSSLRSSGAGLGVVDVTNPDKPTRRAIYADSSGKATGVRALGSLAVLGRVTYSESIGGPTLGAISLIDVSNPASPVRRGGYSSLNTVAGLDTVGARIYVADASAGLQILELDLPIKKFLPLVSR
jgi:hypothetical protein